METVFSQKMKAVVFAGLALLACVMLGLSH